MVENLETHELGEDIDERGNLIKEIAEGATLEEAVWKIDKGQQAKAAKYIELNQKIDELPKFEMNAVRETILEFLTNELSSQGETYRDYGIVQYFSRSSQPIKFWESCTFNTEDGKFEDFLNNKIRPAVEGMIEDLGGNK